MKPFLLALFLIHSLIRLSTNVHSQNCANLYITQQADIASTCNYMAITMMHDALDRPYLFIANKEAGLKVYDISTLAAPVLVATIPITLFDTLDVMNLSQDGNYLYLAVGNSFTNPQAGGMAIVDITNPAAPLVTDYYVVPNSASGSGIVKTEGNYAYLGAMQSGLVILDISDKNNIQLVSQFMPSINFPPINNPNPVLYNARGMEVKNSIVYLCFDAGGFRIINCTNKQAPVEIGHWCNSVMYTPFDHAKAYNNIVIDDTLAYIAVDYCGMEVVNISDVNNLTLKGWWNPYNCPNNNWFTSAVHSNEIHYNSACKQIFLSTGKSDLMVVDVSNPSQPDSCNFYGGTANNLGTWGLGLYQNQIYLSYICAVVPFSSNWTGVKILSYTPCITSGVEEEGDTENGFRFFPQPASDELIIEIKNDDLNPKALKYNISNALGQEFDLPFKINSNKKATFDITNLPAGIYYLKLQVNQKLITRKFIKS